MSSKTIWKEIIVYLIYCGYQPEIFEFILSKNIKLIVILDEHFQKMVELLREHNAKQGLPFDDMFDRIKLYRIGSFDSIEQLQGVCVDIKVNEYPVLGVTLMDEIRQYGAGFIASQFDNFKFLPTNTVMCRDKRSMKYHLSKAGVRCAKFVSVAQIDDVQTREKAAALNYPVIVKPASGLGSTSTEKADTPAQLNAFFDSYKLATHIISDHLIVEEFVDGEEYHCDVLFLNSEPVVLSIGKYNANVLTINKDENMHLGGCLLPEAEHASLYAKATTMAKQVVDVIGYQTGLVHMEFFVETGSDELVFSEVAARLGASATECLQRKYGPGLIGKYINILTGDDDPSYPYNRNDKKYYGYMRFEVRKQGEITKVTSAQEVLKMESVVDCMPLRELGNVLTMKSTSWMKVLFETDDYQSFVDCSQRVAELVEFEVDESKAPKKKDEG
ncbi:MAG: hypothetical protein ACI9FJ_002508 [Alteromonadaceae bacterium]